MIAFSLAADFKGSSSWGRMDFFLFVTITSWLLVIARLVSCCCVAFDAISIFKLAIDFTICGNLLVRVSYYEKNYMVEYSDNHLSPCLVLSSVSHLSHQFQTPPAHGTWDDNSILSFCSDILSGPLQF